MTFNDVQTEARNEGEESVFDMDFPMEPLVSNFSDSHFSLYLNGEKYEAGEVMDYAKKVFADSFDRTSLSKFTDEKQVRIIFISRYIDYGLSKVWQYGSWSFQTGYIKFERFLPKNQQVFF